MTTRREFIKLLGGAAAWPLAARAQQGERMRRIGVLEGFAESNREGQERASAFREGLKQLGWVEGRNIQIDIRWATPGDAELIRRLARELVALRPPLGLGRLRSRQRDRDDEGRPLCLHALLLQAAA